MTRGQDKRLHIFYIFNKYQLVSLPNDYYNRGLNLSFAENL